MKVVFDTNVLISSTLWQGSVSQKLLFKLIKENIKIYSSKEILLEYQKILKRDFNYSDKEISEIMDKILIFVTLVEPKEKVRIVKDDPEDDKIIETAIASFSDYILTYDKHLLKLKKFKNVKIIKPEKLISFFK